MTAGGDRADLTNPRGNAAAKAPAAAARLRQLVSAMKSRRRLPAITVVSCAPCSRASAPFTPDAFQLEALAALEFEDVLVTAPTGSGKTWIAREEIRRLLEQGKRAWYTTPLKALTNSKYQEFGAEFGSERVGILTGDRKENSDAPLIVGTTEIF